MMIQRDSNPWPPRYLCDALPTELWSHAGSRSGACMRVQFMDPLHIMGMQPIWRTKQKKFSFLGIEIYSHVKKNLIVLSSRLAVLPRTCNCKGSLPVKCCLITADLCISRPRIAILCLPWADSRFSSVVFLRFLSDLQASEEPLSTSSGIRLLLPRKKKLLNWDTTGSTFERMVVDDAISSSCLSSAYTEQHSS